MRADKIELRAAAVEKPEELNVIVGRTHFIKTVEDLHEALAADRDGFGSSHTKARNGSIGGCER
jgi:adenosine/AMP kinase